MYRTVMPSSHMIEGREIRLPRRLERGYVLLTMGVASIVVFGALGMAVDLGRMFIGKTEIQTFSDSAALAAALKLDGTSTGITAAQSAVAHNANSWNLGSTNVTSFQVDFSTASAGPWETNPNPATGYIYVRVQATAPVSLYFIPVVVSKQSQDVKAVAVAGQLLQSSMQQGLGPYTAVGPDPTDPVNFGLVPGQQYDIQWPAYNGSRGGCGAGNPERCFVQPPCSGESRAAEQQVVQQWGASVNGYWGANANSTISGEVLDGIQLQPVSVGSNIIMSSGNKNAEAVALDTRVNQDGDIIDNVPATYLNSDAHNGRRLFALPVVTPVSVGGNAEGYVLGYASFFLLSNGNPSDFYASGTGNDPFCAVYIGPYTQSGMGPGGSGTAGYYKVKLVQ